MPQSNSDIDLIVYLYPSIVSVQVTRRTQKKLIHDVVNKAVAARKVKKQTCSAIWIATALARGGKE
jgi:hypothetical protein